MITLERWRRGGEEFSLDELVAAANELLPRYLPEEQGDARQRSEVNVRLVRHLQTSKLMDEAGRSGREARYSFRHLLQVLAARRLMAEGYGAGAIRRLLEGASLERLESLLHGGAQVTVQDVVEAPPKPNAALDFLRSVKARDKGIVSFESPMAMPAPSAPPPTPAPEEEPQRWTRFEVRPGLELHVREEFRAPATPHERGKVLEEVERLLRALSASGGTRRRKS